MNPAPFLVPITCWEKWEQQEDKSWDWQHNHIEEGHCPNDLPTPKVELHKRAWAKGPWRKSFNYLNEDRIVV
jgi:hypothetical protein